MKKCLLSFIVFGLSIFCFLGCSNNVDDTEYILDLRIKNGDSENVSKIVQLGYNEEVTETEHVKVENVEGGIKFTITKPTEDCYDTTKDDGMGYLAIYDDTANEKATCAVLNSYGFGEDGTLEVVYPLCVPGKKYSFKVQLEPTDVNNNRDAQYFERLTIVAEDGIGDIDYTNIEKMNRYLNTSYQNGTLNVSVKNIIPPNTIESTPHFDIFVGNKDWNTNNATKYLSGVDLDSLNQVFDEPQDFNWTISSKIENNVSMQEIFAASDKDKYFIQFYFKFNLEDGQDENISYFKTALIESDLATIN